MQIDQSLMIIIKNVCLLVDGSSPFSAADCVFSLTKAAEDVTISSKTRTGGEQGSARVEGGLSLR